MAVEEARKGSISEDKTSIIQTPITNTNPRLPREGDEVDDEPEEGEIVGETDSASSNPSKGLVQQRHSLEHSWTFWFYNTSAKSKQADWGRFMSLIYTFPTVEDFWSIYNNICQPSRLAVGADFYCFKCNIEPKWEDPVCANGGKWTMTLPNKGKADTCWLYTLLAMIGEQFEHGDDICGAVVNVRPKYRISIWTKNASNEAAQLSIGKQWKEILDCNESLGFIFHEDAKNKGAKNKYTL